MEQDIETLRQQLKQQEKLASLGMLSAGIAHEIQNPLNFVINFSKMSTKLLSDLNDIMEDNEEKLSDDDRQEVEDIISDLTPLIKEELNIKQVIFEKDLDEYMNFSLKPNFRVAGPALGKNIKAFGAAMAKAWSSHKT